ncbi:tyrosine-type recombinase/integrase [Microvirga alba]|uniref:Site-specific integrase n=1 Tax=Microvirga alba TaxID=2791025 RepID=A0A931BVM3_9HYPH|nr:site-specific integrase [Microvirga alba]MBF9235544.1 site-specific integrase [Microvirga alba]
MLTDKQIQRAIRELKTETTLNDGAAGRGTGSLRLRLRPTAAGVSATWMAFWKKDGKRQTKPLGRYPDMSLAEAREAFGGEVRQVLHAGRNPRAVVQAVEKPTVEALFQSYVAHLRTAGTATVDEIERILLLRSSNCADGLGRHRNAADIEPADVSKHLASHFARGVRRQTDLMRTYMHAAFSWGMKATHDYRAENRKDWGIKANPVSAIPKDTEASQARERNLSADEIRAVWNAAPDQTGDVLRLVIACGQRVLETIKVEGKEIDLDRALWNMPAHKTKLRKRPHTIPLPRQAVEIFRELKAIHGDGPLFPARQGSKHGPFIGIPSVSRGASRLTCCDPFQPRDLRRTWKSRAGDGAKISKELRDLIQQHALEGDTGSKHYDRADYLPQLRAAMDKWEAWLDQALQPKEEQAAA